MGNTLSQFLWKEVENFKDLLSQTFEQDPGLTDDLLEVLYEDDGTNYETKKLGGYVTKVLDSKSLAIIDHEIYMDLAIPCPGGKRLRQGDFILAAVKRRCPEDAWTVERVETVDRSSSAWNKYEDDEENTNNGALLELPSFLNEGEAIVADHLHCKTVVGQVHGITAGKMVKVNHGEIQEFDQTLVSEDIYAVGDWLALKVLFDPEEPEQKPRCIKSHPLRKWKFEGRVNIVEGDKGVIDNDVYFQTSACINGYTPRLKDFVHVNAIESNAGGMAFTWRAVSIAPSSNCLRGNNRQQQQPMNVTNKRPNLRDTCEISVEREADFGTMEIGTSKELVVKVSNIDALEHLMIDAKFLNQRSNFVIKDHSFPVMIPVDGSINITVSFKASNMGKSEDILELDFGKFLIERVVSADVITSGGSSSPTNGKSGSSFLERFKQKQNVSRRQVMEDESFRDSNWVLKGVRPYKLPPFTSMRLGEYKVPHSLWTAISQKQDLVVVNPVLGDNLSSQNYVTRFQTLLHLEEVETTLRLRAYDMDRVSLRHVGPFLALEVNGLAEKRPSLVIGDTVILSNPWGAKGLCYEGFVHQTLKSEVLIKFNEDFHMKYDGEDYAVRFQFNRTPLRRHHTAVENSAKHPGYKVLFPNKEALETRPPQFVVSQSNKKVSVADRLFPNVDSIKWVNPCLNEQQRRAVWRILEGTYRPIPYIIYGPPGTGKTVTVVEAILQVFLLCPRSRILIATPSNSSADLVAQRLHLSGRIQPGDMVRLNAFSRNPDSMPNEIIPYAMNCEELQKAVRHRILITTCTTSGKIYTMGLQHGHFTHLFIDEAGQATEPETLVSLGLLRYDLHPGQIVLAGDPKQLGPVLMSQYSGAYGLSLSLLERLSLNPLYGRKEEHAETGHYNPYLLTKLVQNYRSHPALLSLPSYMFYENELVACAPPEVAEKLAHFSWLPTAGIPLVFHGTRGENIQEPDSPSWCNPAEVYHVVRYLQLLLNAKINPEDVGVITPYRKQVEKLRDFIKVNNLCSFKVGSVEEFQGQERDVIVVSTVRSNESYVDDDVTHHLGFLSSPKRFNVTVTRAKSLLIVIGNPHLLIHDKFWGPFLRRCVQLGAYTGCDLPQM